MPKILLVEDDPELAATVQKWLTLDRHTVEHVNKGQEAINVLASWQFDLIILDWHLPDMEGIDILKELRRKGRSTRVLMLTGRGSVGDKKAGLNAGADDYLTKPFHGDELTARVQALLRRPGGYVETILTFGNLALDPEKIRLTRNEEEIHLTGMEFALMEFLMRHPNQIFSPEALLSRVWTSQSLGTVDAVAACIKRLRKKIDIDGNPTMIESVHGQGYKLTLA